uniref:Uncharacterized protein n=1 Tax=Pristionchus pacificus TaxID=54126 RepID=A0A2A6CWY9_PRIPA|eukprot:PDM82541.1 hypothetical protein PRIPAC_36934 [Pristionchus pacificus]
MLLTQSLKTQTGLPIPSFPYNQRLPETFLGTSPVMSNEVYGDSHVAMAFPQLTAANKALNRSHELLEVDEQFMTMPAISTYTEQQITTVTTSESLITTVTNHYSH